MRHSAAAVISDKRPLGRILLLRVLEIRSSAGEKKVNLIFPLFLNCS